MGFFTGLTRLIKGEPVFQPGDIPPDKIQRSSQQPPPIPVQPATGQHAGPKDTPEVFIERVDCRERGQNDMDCDVVIKNHSHQVVELDRIELLGHTLRLNTDDIRPGEKRTYRAYSGDRPDDPHENECTLYYRTYGTGDYFCSEHYVQYRQLPDGSYLVDRMRFQDVRDA